MTPDEYKREIAAAVLAFDDRAFDLLDELDYLDPYTANLLKRGIADGSWPAVPVKEA